MGKSTTTITKPAVKRAGAPTSPKKSTATSAAKPKATAAPRKSSSTARTAKTPVASIPAQSTGTTAVAAGWYPDASAADQMRFWDGSRWSNEVAVAQAPAPTMTHPVMAAAPFAAPQSPMEAKAQAAAAKAYAKANRKWFKKKRFVLPAVGLAAVIAISAGSAGSGEKPAAGSPAAKAAAKPAAANRLYPGRVDAQKEDQEFAVGGSARLSGYTATVKTASFKRQLNDFQTDGYVVASVTVLNRDDKTQTYNMFDWKIQTPNGQVIDPTFSIDNNQVNSGDLVSGGSVSGTVTFEVGSTKGQYFIIYKPDPFDAARGIWGVKV